MPWSPDRGQHLPAGRNGAAPCQSLCRSVPIVVRAPVRQGVGPPADGETACVRQRPARSVAVRQRVPARDGIGEMWQSGKVAISLPPRPCCRLWPCVSTALLAVPVFLTVTEFGEALSLRRR